MEAQKTLTDFIVEHGITMDARPAAGNPNTEPDEWSKGASHWLCVLSRSGQTMPVPFSQGAGHRRWNADDVRAYRGTYTKDEIAKLSPVLGSRGLGGAPVSIALRELREECSEPSPPETASVLDCLASDAASYDNARDFEDWCADFGMDTDSRKAARTYRVCGEQAKALRHFLGNLAYQELLFNTERL